jgi:hypothetical protein
MEEASISGLQYQKGTLAGFEVREYLLEKFGIGGVFTAASRCSAESRSRRPEVGRRI